MKCPVCQADLAAVDSGPPTTWQCNDCSVGLKVPVQFKGDTPSTLTEV